MVKRNVEFCQQFKSIQTLRNYQRKVTFRSVGCAVRVFLRSDFWRKLTHRLLNSTLQHQKFGATNVSSRSSYFGKFSNESTGKISQEIQWPYVGQIYVVYSLHFLMRKYPELNYEIVNKWWHISQIFKNWYSELSSRFCFHRKMELLIRPIRHVARF